MTTIIATDLSSAARERLITFCADNLKARCDAATYADGLISEADMSDGAHFEIRGLHTTTGNPVTISFGEDADFVWSEIDDDGNAIG